MTNFRLLAGGDPVVWGQGLRHSNKFTTLFCLALTGQEWPEEDMLARPGAVAGIGQDRDPISSSLVPDQQAREGAITDGPSALALLWCEPLLQQPSD
jgi:lysophospholipase L1-like esterase